MYPSVRNIPKVERTGTSAPRRARRLQVDSNVVFLGLTSLFTDISSESVTAILPIYLTFQLRFSPFQLGLFNGSYEGVTGLMRVFGGRFADRSQRHREVAGAGYGLSAACKVGLLASSNAWVPTTGFLMADRMGKGVRTAPRDALISLSSPPDRLGEAFGVHRALDTVGALIGPVLAFAILWAVPGAYDVIFLTSFVAAIIGLAVLFLFVQNRRREDTPPRHERERLSFRALFRIRRFRTIVLCGLLLSALTVGDAFVYLTFQHRSDMNTKWFPLLYVGTATTYLLLAVPFGRIADRYGRGKMFLFGHLCLAGVYAALLLPRLGGGELLLVLTLLGTYYAATDGVLMALSSVFIPSDLRASGLAVVTTATATGRFIGPIVFGLVWANWSPETALWLFLIGLGLAVPAVGAAFTAQRRALAG